MLSREERMSGYVEKDKKIYFNGCLVGDLSELGFVDGDRVTLSNEVKHFAKVLFCFIKK